ncbi:MAG TPA: formate dehydrogenase subunit gamma [Candidatus Limnocylindria bacterium]|nr:formate dehydrogenase subunit gamma [Candidatus Limnocylindria bacterium]
MPKYVERFNTAERVLHWFVTLSFFTLLFSGLGLFARVFHEYFNLFGGGEGAILVHKYAGVVFFVSSLLLFLNHYKEMITFDEDDRTWFRQLGGYLSKDPEHIESGKFNAGQKVFGIFMGIATLLLGITGIINWFPLSFPRGIVQFSLMLHGLLFVLFIMIVIVHAYLTTIGNPGTLEGMLYGNVRKIWARMHHPKWHKEVSGK